MVPTSTLSDSHIYLPSLPTLYVLDYLKNLFGIKCLCTYLLCFPSCISRGLEFMHFENQYKNITTDQYTHHQLPNQISNHVLEWPYSLPPLHTTLIPIQPSSSQMNFQLQPRPKTPPLTPEKRASPCTLEWAEWVRYVEHHFPSLMGEWQILPRTRWWHLMATKA